MLLWLRSYTSARTQCVLCSLYQRITSWVQAVEYHRNRMQGKRRSRAEDCRRIEIVWWLKKRQQHINCADRVLLVKTGVHQFRRWALKCNNMCRVSIKVTISENVLRSRAFNFKCYDLGSRALWKIEEFWFITETCYRIISK